MPTRTCNRFSRPWSTIALAALLLLAIPVAAHAQEHAFAPSSWTGTVTLSATTSSSITQVNPTTGAASPNQRIYNSGTVPVFIACGAVSVVTNPTVGMPIAPGTVEIIGCGEQYMAGVTASGTATLYITRGAGL